MRNITWAAGAALLLAIAPAHAQDVTLKVHHFLPAGSAANTMFIQPWCDRIAKDSGGKMKCQIYPSMQLGGTPPQLYDQVKDGVVDVIWTLPGYTAGRFPLVEVFELPFMMNEPEGTSKALWEYVQQYAPNEFADVKLIATHVHGPGVFHTTNKQIKTLADLKGMKVRAPTRQTNRFLAALGATPVAMPVPQVGEALSKGVIDGAVIPWEVVPSVKVQELTKFHTETDPVGAGVLHLGVHLRDEQGQVRGAAARPEEGHRRQQRRRALRADRQGVRRGRRHRREDRAGEQRQRHPARRARRLDQARACRSPTPGSPTSRPRAPTASSCSTARRR